VVIFVFSRRKKELDHMLTIARALDNNAVLVNLNHERQALVQGKGIGFNKKSGDLITPDRVEKIFYLDSKVSQQNLYFLLKDIPIDVVMTTYEIIDMAKKQFHIQVLDYIYITLSDHIYGAFKRLQAGKYVETMVPDLSAQYSREYAAAMKALHIINTNLHANFPATEVRSLALHFINASGDDSEEQEELKAGPGEEVSKIVLGILNKNGIYRTAKNGNYYDRFMVHLQYLVDRIRHLESDNTRLAPAVENQLRTNYPHSYRIGVEIFQQVKQRLYPGINDNERLYFIIHIQRLTDEMIQRNK
jgi:transcriptional antiterminator